MTYSVWTALAFALFVVMLTGRLDLTVASTLCTIKNVLVEGSVDTAGVSTTEVNVRALGHCHNNDTVATILKTANTEKVRKTASMHAQLTTINLKYGAPYRRSCRKGLLKSIYTKDGDQGSDGQSANRVQAPITVLLCFCQLGGGFDTDVIFQDSSYLQDGGYLVDGDMRVERSRDLDIFDTHEFNNHGIGMCKEFRRRALANCVRSGSQELPSAPEERLHKCMSYFDLLAGLVKYNSHATPTSFKPLFKQHWPKSLIDDMISREISVLGLHHASMREALPKDTPTGRTALAQQPQIVEVLAMLPVP